ncbi:MAG: S41 family peptidase, partial [Candidatus Zixiibacteriota bacterium]
MTIPRFSGCRRHGKLMVLTCAISLLTGLSLYGQTPEEGKSALDDSMKARVLDSVLSAFEVHYVYPDTALIMSRHVRDRHNNREYDGLTNLEELTRQLTADLMKISLDRHIRVSVMSPDDFSPAIGDTITRDRIAERMLSNCSFRKVEWLQGNIGYLRFDRFEDPSYAGATAVGAMDFLANCDAVIIDLRYNGGGDEKMVRLISSYFFKEPTQLNSLYFTESDSLEQSWTFSYVPGKKPVDADLYILTSRNTGSGAEAFTYNMKHLERATIVGEV